MSDEWDRLFEAADAEPGTGDAAGPSSLPVPPLPVVDAAEPLEGTLRRVFGYHAFRPLQREIIQDSLAGRDVFALLPTGGGKSLCFQLPALRRPGLTVVISPLIALMKDQVDALRANGVGAACLNSSLDDAARREAWRRLHRGEIRLLYVAPERLFAGTMLEELARWQLGAVAVDEAHCISEWGHDFRPEYRQLSQLRERFPQVPFLALTATATQRVREDIVRQLHLRDPATYVASFNRPNLTYRIEAKGQTAERIARLARARKGEAGIVYCASRNATEALAERLVKEGVKALPYHAGLTPETRAANQERFLRDEVQVMCATIAFGMGINKPNVRFVLHHDLPKNIEGYYQETGRAGRDGLPSECILYFSPGDVAKQIAFIDEKTDENERAVASAQLRQMVHYAESAGCRRVSLLGYFGETFPPGGCGACDNCLSPREDYDGTVHAQKFLSCAYRVRQKSGFDVGLNHLVAILTGSEAEGVLRWQHHTLSTFGIGKEMGRNEWGAIGRELVRLGLLQQAPGQMPTVSLTTEGVAALRERRTVRLTKPRETPKASVPRSSTPSGSIACDEILFEKLRRLRKRLADEQGVPPYIVFGDVSLRHMARDYPTTERDLLAVPGVGETKLRVYGDEFLGEIQEHVRANGGPKE
ncbi:MAG: DNA helicase RecQ [Verrucomicrobiota bacterium]